MEVFNQLRHYEGLRLLPSVCGWKLIQQTLFIVTMPDESGIAVIDIILQLHLRYLSPLQVRGLQQACAGT